MSQENVERLRVSYEVFNRVGFDVTWAEDFWHPEIVWETDPSVPEPGIYEGFEAVWDYLRGFQPAFDAFQVEVAQLIDLGGDDVLSLLTLQGKPLGQGGGTTPIADWCWIVSLREGKIVRIRSFLDKRRGFEAAGVSE